MTIQILEEENLSGWKKFAEEALWIAMLVIAMVILGFVSLFRPRFRQPCT